MPLISFIIPAYNCEAYVGKAVECVRAQTVKDWELILVDDGSTDGTAGVVRGFHDERIIYVHQTNRGVSAARNRGLDQARGEFLAFLDGDDEVAPDFLEKCLAALRSSDADMAVPSVYAHKKMLGEGRAELDVRQRPDYPDTAEGLYARLFETFAGSTAMLARRECFEGRRYDENIHQGEDLELWIRLAGAGFKAVTAESEHPLYFYRIHSGSLTGRAGRRAAGKRWRDLYTVYRRHEEEALSRDSELRSVIAGKYRRIARNLVSARSGLGLAGRLYFRSFLLSAGQGTAG